MFIVDKVLHAAPITLCQAHSYVKMCIATGGGIVTEPKNWGKMQTGMVVWLDMEVRDGRFSTHGNSNEISREYVFV